MQHPSPGPDVGKPKPYITENGELRIPFTSDRRYWWWAGGQSVRETLVELGASPEVWRNYTSDPYPESLNGHDAKQGGKNGRDD
ncbi:MAG: hypothetical protein HRF45_09385 [Fimbriimonadia bacterium]